MTHCAPPRPAPPPAQLRRNAQRAALTAASVFLDAMLMLVVMTFNLGLIICVTLGYALGALGFGERCHAGGAGAPRRGGGECGAEGLLVCLGVGAQRGVRDLMAGLVAGLRAWAAEAPPPSPPSPRLAGHLRERTAAAAPAGAKAAPNPLFIVGSMQPTVDEGYDPLQLEQQRSLRQIHTQQ